MKSNFFKTTLILAGTGIFLVLSLTFYIFLMPNTYHEPQGKIVTISRGTSFNGVAEIMASAGVIRSKWAFKIAGRILGYTKSIRVGKYLFVSGQSNATLLRDISEGKSRLVIPVTIPEGWRIEQIAHRYRRDLGIDSEHFISLCRDTVFIRQHHIDAPSLEGYLLPDTYAFYWQNEESEIIERMLDGFRKFYTDSLVEQQKKINCTESQVLTLASIVEAESNLNEERPTIAGVYWNRLRKHMRLEADPTVQYALGKERRLNFQDLEINSPYNTYKHIGLPPGPINNPGRLSILAALFPEEHNYLYFVATGVGGHHFAKSFTDHQKNINSYHRVRRALKHAKKQQS